MDNYIRIRGARQHNLKNIDLDIPKNKLVVFTGVSGSGKSSLAFDTIYAEGQRRYVESLSSYARQFLGIMQKPDVDLIEGLSPAISIDQKTTSHNPRSTVGTVTEIYDYLRLLYARIGHPHCPICGREIMSQSLDQIVDNALTLLKDTLGANKYVRAMILSPVVKDKKGEFSNLLTNLKAKGYQRCRIDGKFVDLNEDIYLIKTNKHTIDVLIDKISVDKKALAEEGEIKRRLTDSLEQALHLSDGLAIVSIVHDAGFEFPPNPKDLTDHLFSQRFSCPFDNLSLPEIEPRTFSFNSPHGAFPKCTGLGKIRKVNIDALFSPDLTINEGGILPFSNMFENDTWYGRVVKKVCEEEGISLVTPIKALDEKAISILLQGTGSKGYKVYGTNRFGNKTYIWEKFIGIVPELERRYKDTESDYVRGEIEKYMKEVVCEACGGARLKEEARAVTIMGISIDRLVGMSVSSSYDWLLKLGENLSKRESQIASLVTKEILARLSFLKAVGLEYLTIDRPAGTLAGGEAQRIRLASQIGSGLTGVLYVLDEPTIGLHQKDNDRLIQTLLKLRDLGNSVLVVEHDREMMESADFIFDFGPGAGKNGGELVAQGKISEIKANPKSLTGKYLSGAKRISSHIQKRLFTKSKELKIFGARQFNLKRIDVSFPLGKLIVVTGVSGSGKSTLVVETLYHAVAQKINRDHRDTPGAFSRLEGVDELDKVILIDQSPIGRTPRSNPATYTKLFDLIRKVYSQTKEARASGYKEGRFSFNVKGGRCEACEGQGQIKIEMQFMPDIWVPCEVCKGSRFNSHTLEVFYKGKNISDILNLSVAEAKTFFEAHPGIVSKLDTLINVGMDYIELGQPATTLSGGEAQRIKLAAELGKRHTGKTLYLLDEPTTGLHFADLQKLLNVLQILVSKGNTVIVIEHNLDIIKNADWIIDLGPGGGDKGGYVVAVGTPEELAKNKDSFTGKYLR